MSELFFVYILTNIHHNVFYVGVTNDLIRRVFEHKNKLMKGFSYKYNIDKLVYYEAFGSIELAILHEKRVKRWSRPIKCDAVQRMNPEWDDLYIMLTEASKPSQPHTNRHPGLVPGSPSMYALHMPRAALTQPSLEEIPGQARDDENVLDDDTVRNKELAP